MRNIELQNALDRSLSGLQFREEMKAAVLARIEAGEEEAAPVMPGGRHRGLRRGAAAALVCTALLLTALAAGPGIWSLIQEHLGPRAPYATGAAGAVRDQGIEFGAAAALADRNTVRVSPFGIWRESG